VSLIKDLLNITNSVTFKRSSILPWYDSSIVVNQIAPSNN